MDIHHIVIIHRDGSHLVLAGTDTYELLDQLVDVLNEDLSDVLDERFNDDDYDDVTISDALDTSDLEDATSQLYRQYLNSLDGADDPIDVIAFTTIVDLVVRD